MAEFADKLKNINFHFLGLNMIEKPSLMFWNTPEWQNGLWYIALLMFLIPFISAGLTILQTMLSQKMNPPQDAQTAQTSKTMNLVMPLMSIYICFIMPVSMGLYWIEQSVLGIIQEAILNRYYKTKLDAEMAEFNEAQRKKDAEMEAKRAETERLKAEGYRSKREESLVHLAHKMAAKAIKYKRSMALEPMNSYERHVIHTALQDYEGVSTSSTGVEPNRRVVVNY